MYWSPQNSFYGSSGEQKRWCWNQAKVDSCPKFKRGKRFVANLNATSVLISGIFLVSQVLRKNIGSIYTLYKIYNLHFKIKVRIT